MNSAGRVLIKPCGEWNAETTYFMLDLVNHKGYAYLAKRTIVGIEPSDSSTEYWHNLLDINKVIEDGISGTLATDITKILEERFAELLSEAKYVTDLFADFDAPTFVRWDTNTANTPYTSGLTSCYEGYALAFGKASTSHSITAWTKGGTRNECFTHSVSDGKDNGWDSTISASGGTMTGPLNLGGGLGRVYADETGTYLGAYSGNNEKSNKLKISNPKDGKEELKFSTPSGEHELFGEHNVASLASLLGEVGCAKIQIGTYEGSNSVGPNYPTELTFNFEPKIVFIRCNKTEKYDGDHTTYLLEPFINGVTYNFGRKTRDDVSSVPFYLYTSWQGNKLSFYYTTDGKSDRDDSLRSPYQMNNSGQTYTYIAIG